MSEETKYQSVTCVKDEYEDETCQTTKEGTVPKCILYKCMPKQSNPVSWKKFLYNFQQMKLICFYLSEYVTEAEKELDEFVARRYNTSIQTSVV